MDVKNAFLNSDLEEVVYMDLRPGFIKESRAGKICRLSHSMAWNNLLVHGSIVFQILYIIKDTLKLT